MTLGLAGISNVAAERRQNKAPGANRASRGSEARKRAAPEGRKKISQTLLSASYDLFEESQEHA
jgi:hypothetical protein